MDYFRFTAQQGSTITIEAHTGTLSDTHLTLYNSSGAQLDENDDVSDLGLGSRIVWTAGSDGDYYVRVRPYNQNTQTGTYTLSLSRSVDDHGDSIGSATGINAGAVTGTIDPSSDLDYFRFSAQAGFEVTIEARTGTLSDTYLTLFDAAGNQLDSNDDTPDLGLGSRIVWSPNFDGDYFVELRPYRRQSQTGSYTLNLNISPPASASAADHNAASENVAALLVFGGAFTATPCAINEVSIAPLRTTDIGVMEVGETFSVCLTGFTRGEPVDMELTAPDGTVIDRGEITPPDQGIGVWFTTVMPGNPLGAYKLTAAQQSTRWTAVGTVQVESPTGPRIGFRPRGFAHGATNQIGLAGFEPSTVHRLHIYYACNIIGHPRCPSIPGTLIQSINYAYQYTLPSVQTDSLGQALVELGNLRDDPGGQYVVKVVGGSWRLHAGYTLESGTDFPEFVLDPGDPQSRLARNDLIPATGVSPVLSSNFVFSLSCAFVPSIRPDANTAFSDVRVAAPVRICLTGFSGSADINVQLAAPNGSVIDQATVTTNDSGTAAWSTIVLPGEPFGRYEITASQLAVIRVIQGPRSTFVRNTRSGSGSFNVTAATEASVAVRPVRAVAGTPLSVGVTGFEPRAVEEVHIYRRCSTQSSQSDGLPQCPQLPTPSIAFQNPYGYGSTLDPVRLNARGEAVIGIDTNTGDPAGSYRAYVYTQSGVRWADFTVLPGAAAPTGPVTVVPDAVTLTGTYNGTETARSGTSAPIQLQLEEGGGLVTGHLTISPPHVGSGDLTGSVDGDSLVFSVSARISNSLVVTEYTATISNQLTTIRGQYVARDSFRRVVDTGTWEVFSQPGS